jgi:hypothetical protein
MTDRVNDSLEPCNLSPNIWPGWGSLLRQASIFRCFFFICFLFSWWHDRFVVRNRLWRPCHECFSFFGRIVCSNSFVFWFCSAVQSSIGCLSASRGSVSRIERVLIAFSLIFYRSNRWLGMLYFPWARFILWALNRGLLTRCEQVEE